MSGSRAIDYRSDSSVWKVGLDLDQAATANDNLYTLAYNQIPQIAQVTATKARVCQYENSSNGDFLIDFHPRLANVLLVGGGSGHGFKHGPEVGRMAAERLLGLGKVEPRFSLASKSETHKREVI